MPQKTTVRDLIQMLQGYDETMEVHFAYNYGDRGRTTVAPRVYMIEEAEVAWSEYHRMDVVVGDDDVLDADGNPRSRTVVVLR